MVDLDIEILPQTDPRLGRHKVHDPRSKDHPLELAVTPKPHTWVTKVIKINDPVPNPNQCHGECTGCANAMMLNSQGSLTQRPLMMDHAHKVYSLATQIDPFEGSWPPTDTGSSGLAAAKAAQQLGLGGEYKHIFNGADGIVEAVQNDRVVSVGTKWYNNMFTPDRDFVIQATGDLAGGHQYVAMGYDAARDMVLLRCWWGRFRGAWIKRAQLNDLVMDGGDAHVQDRIIH